MIDSFKYPCCAYFSLRKETSRNDDISTFYYPLHIINNSYKALANQIRSIQIRKNFKKKTFNKFAACKSEIVKNVSESKAKYITND